MLWYVMSNEFDQSKLAMDKEMDSLKSNNTWILVEKPEDKKVLYVKWVYKKKPNVIYKAKLVVKGFQQVDGVEGQWQKHRP